MSTTEGIPGFNARYTERLATALSPVWSAGRRIVWRGSETYRFTNPLRQRLDFLETHYDILVDGFPRSGNTRRRDVHRDLSDESCRYSDRLSHPGRIEEGCRIRQARRYLIQNLEEVVSSWMILRRRSLGDRAFRSDAQYRRSLRSVAGDLFVVPFEAIPRRMPAAVEVFSVRYGLGDRGL